MRGSNIIIAVLAAAMLTGCSSSTLHGTIGNKGVAQPGTGQAPSSSGQHSTPTPPSRHRRTVAPGSGTARSAAPPARPAHPLRAIGKTLATYFGGINDGDYWSAYDTFGPAVRARLSESSFAVGDSTSHDSHERVLGIALSGPNAVNVILSFTSHQASFKGPNGDICDRWHLIYHMIRAGNGRWYINGTSPYGGSDHTTCGHPHRSPRAPAPPPPPTHTGCYPMSNEGTCYEPGEYCRESDAGVTGVAGDGERITCEDNNGLRWEPPARAKHEQRRPGQSD